MSRGAPLSSSVSDPRRPGSPPAARSATAEGARRALRRRRRRPGHRRASHRARPGPRMGDRQPGPATPASARRADRGVRPRALAADLRRQRPRQLPLRPGLSSGDAGAGPGGIVPDEQRGRGPGSGLRRGLHRDQARPGRPGPVAAPGVREAAGSSSSRSAPASWKATMTDRAIRGMVERQRPLRRKRPAGKIAATNPQRRIIPAEEVAEAVALACSGAIPFCQRPPSDAQRRASPRRPHGPATRSRSSTGFADGAAAPLAACWSRSAAAPTGCAFCFGSASQALPGRFFATCLGETLKARLLFEGRGPLESAQPAGPGDAGGAALGRA